MIFKIAKTELRNLFYSPIAWFLIIVFLIQCGMVYMGLINTNARSQEMGGRALEYMKELTDRVYTGKGGLFSSVMGNLYLYIPLLTMGLISREINGGTIKLLYSSPVTVSQIVLGKYLAIMIYSMILVFIVGIFMVAGAFHIVHVDFGMLISAALGFYLLLAVYSAIGLFMSSLTTYQVVAALSTFVMIGILSYIGDVFQDIDFVRDITYFLSLSGRTNHMLRGLITSKDVLYFILIAYMFVALTIYKLKAGRESLSFAVKTGRYAAIIISALLVGYISSRPALIAYLDTTANKNNTLTPNAQHIVEELGKDKLEITVYNNLLDSHAWLGFPEMRNRYLSVWEYYTRFKPDIEFKFVNYYDSIPDISNMKMQYPGKNLEQMAQLQAKNLSVDFKMFKSPAEIHKIIDLKPEDNRFVMHLKYKNKTTFLRVFDDQQIFPSETEVAAAFKRLMSAKLPKIAFLTGDLERDITKISDRDYAILSNAPTFRNSLVNQGFDVDTVALDKQDIPSGISTLVIADPRTAFSAVTLAKIQAYIAKGGNLLIAGEPGKQSVLNPVLSALGVKLMDGTIVQPSPQFSADLVLPELTTTAAAFSKPLAKNYKDSLNAIMKGVTGISYTSTSGFNVKPLLMSNKDLSWLKMKKFVTDSAQLVFSAAEGDIHGTFPTAVSLTRKVGNKDQRIIVTGDADFMDNEILKRYSGGTSNFTFSTAVYSWLSEGEFPIDTTRPDAIDNRVTVTMDQVAMQKIIFVWILPALLLAFASVLLIRRKRK